MTTNIEQNINYLTLQELSLEAARLWEQLEEAEDEQSSVEQLLEQLFQVQGATERKIDAIALWAVRSAQSPMLQIITILIC